MILSSLGAMRSIAATGLILSVAMSGAASAQQVFRSGDHVYRAVTVADGLEHPWGMAFLPDGGILITERPGRLRMVRDGVLQLAPVAGVPPVWAEGQGGLLDVAIHPDFELNRLVYFSFAKPGPSGATTAVGRGRLLGDRLEDVEEILEALAWNRGRLQFGSRLVFDDLGYLFVSIGDRGPMEEAQNLANHQGKILRIHDDGRVPTDNPFLGQAGARPEIWAYGIRSPQGLTLHPTTRELWETEHGPRGGDEINVIARGTNYGWPLITYGVNYNGQPITSVTASEGMEQPIHYWVPSIGTAGMTFYTGDRFPAWNGDLLVAALTGMHLARLVVEGRQIVAQERLLDGIGERIRDVRDGPDGYVYLLTDSQNGKLLRLEPVEE